MGDPEFNPTLLPEFPAEKDEFASAPPSPAAQKPRSNAQKRHAALQWVAAAAAAAVIATASFEHDFLGEYFGLGSFSHSHEEPIEFFDPEPTIPAVQEPEPLLPFTPPAEEEPAPESIEEPEPEKEPEPEPVTYTLSERLIGALDTVLSLSQTVLDDGDQTHYENLHAAAEEVYLLMQEESFPSWALESSWYQFGALVDAPSSGPSLRLTVYSPGTESSYMHLCYLTNGADESGEGVLSSGGDKSAYTFIGTLDSLRPGSGVYYAAYNFDGSLSTRLILSGEFVQEEDSCYLENGYTISADLNNYGIEVRDGRLVIAPPLSAYLEVPDWLGAQALTVQYDESAYQTYSTSAASNRGASLEENLWHCFLTRVDTIFSS